ncbi:6633_t:CDS:2 [Paraglomus brasilianum]|uniref:6633_t:CDS:1 n=1 Tax=Paraglomus brasilianum TaxID=144538 RepID=A0A9N8VQG5_9GLOM|nr:6633_t:CDS:2 [Paraglomus brasilianum]
MDVITPRVNYGLLSRYKGRKVRLVGRVIQVHILTLKAEESTIAETSHTVVVEACDKGQVSVRLRQPSNFTTYVEFVGRVNTDLSINEFVFTNFGDTFDLDLHNKVVEYWQRFPDIFPTEELP